MRVVRLNSDDLPSGSSPIEHPQPIILDAKLRFPKSAKLVLPAAPKKPWIFTGLSCDDQRKRELEDLGAKVFMLDVDSLGLVDSFLLTIAPVYVGEDGISAVQHAESAAKFDNISYHTLGRDVMMVAKQQSK
ncbi:2,5-diamino-6-(ribosylamino)-4(3H)-pyrimidinone 5'-phosphate reductase [Entomortierella chlamydospora]|nr:2,5-diamino-6-(ribosylamino)-4(3H)-pyrimidinone 5'-phosphate reductase [Entomortierella chlamydospora]